MLGNGIRVFSSKPKTSERKDSSSASCRLPISIATIAIGIGIIAIKNRKP
jgi:hypothetical protein